MLAPRVSIYAENHVFDHPEILIRDQGVEKKEVIIEKTETEFSVKVPLI
jgi:hypothetical protein